VKYKGKTFRFKILKLIEFDSDRKRMTVVLETDSVIKVYVKGADTSIEKLLAPEQKYLESVR
jgi:magnesium-transporting ATPase (P-type)